MPSATTTCDNCGTRHRSALDVCMVHAFTGLLVERGHSVAVALSLINDLNLHHFFDDINKISDKIEAGEYRYDEDD